MRPNDPQAQQEQHHQHGEDPAAEERGKGMALAEPREAEWRPSPGGAAGGRAHCAFR